MSCVGDVLDEALERGRAIRRSRHRPAGGPSPGSDRPKGTRARICGPRKRDLGAAIVFEWVRVQASMVRGVVTGLALLSRFQYPYRVFDNARSATARLASMDKSLDADRARMLDAIDAAVAE